MIATEMTNGVSTFKIECPADGCPAAKGSSHPDITRSTVPLLIVVGLGIAIAAASFKVGGLFSGYQAEQSAVLDRLNVIEDKLDAVIEAYPQVKASAQRKRKAQKRQDGAQGVRSN